MGQACLKPRINYNFPTKIRISLEDSIVEEDLSVIPDTYESLEQAVSPFVSHHLQLSGTDFINLTHIRSATSSLRIHDQKAFKTALKQSRGKELHIRVSKESYQSAFDLSLLPTGDPTTDLFLDKFRGDLTEFKAKFFSFSERMVSLLEFSSHTSVFMQHPNVEAAVTAVLLTLTCEAKGEFEETGLKLSSEPPYIKIQPEKLSHTALGVLRLWNDFVQFVPRLKELIEALNSHFETALSMIETQIRAAKDVKKKGFASADQIIKTKQSFKEAEKRFLSVQEQLTSIFLKFADPRQLNALIRVSRINHFSLCLNLNSAVALFDLKGNAK